MAGFGESALWGGTGRLEPEAGAEAEAEAFSEVMSAAALMDTRESGAGVRVIRRDGGRCDLGSRRKTLFCGVVGCWSNPAVD